MENKLPVRKHPRLKKYDYSENGYYYITLCTHDKLPILSEVTVGRGLAPAGIELSTIGKTVEKQLLELPLRFPSIEIDKYIIMPTHLHVIIILRYGSAGASHSTGVSLTTRASLAAGTSPRPTLMDVVCAFKSLSTRLCNKNDNMQKRKIWQTSFYDKIIKDEKEYHEIWKYIDENHIKWADDEYYVK